MRRKPSVDAAANWLQRNSTRWGSPVLIVGRWLPGGGTVGSLLAGTLRWKLSRFTPTSLVGSTLWSAYAGMIGYLGGSIIGQPVIGILVSLGVAALTTTLGSLILQRAGRHAGRTDERPVDPATDRHGPQAIPTELVGSSAGGLRGERAERAARELLGAQASDWAFLDRRGQAGDYAWQRTTDHSQALYEAIGCDRVTDPRMRSLAPDLSVAPLLEP